MTEIKFVKAVKPGKCAAMRCEEAGTGEYAIGGRSLALCPRHVTACKHSGQIPAAPGEIGEVAPGDWRPEVEAETVQARADLVATQPFTIVTAADLSFAAEVLAEVKGKAKRLTARKEEITKPLNAALKSVRELFAPALDAYASMEAILKREIGRFELAQEERNRAAMTAAAVAHAEGDTAATAAALAQVGHVASVPGLSARRVWRFQVTDAALIPREFLTVNEALLREFANHSGGEKPPDVPGVVWVPDTIVASRST